MKTLHDASRALRRSPGFTVVAVLTLALGTGAVTALFSVLDGVVLKPLAYPEANRLVSIVSRSPERTAPTIAGGDERDVAAEHGLFDAVAYYHGGEMGVQLGDRAVFTGAVQVHPDFFRVFAIPPLAGRPFNHDDAQRSAIVSAGFAQRQFGSPEGALSNSLFIEDRSYQIVGVMPAAMQFPPNTEIWTASTLDPAIRDRTSSLYRVVARLAPGVSVETASARLSDLSQRLAAAFPVSNSRKTLTAIPLRDNVVGQVRPTLYMLMAAVVLVLLIACANVANLLLARGAGRVRELAIRSALGASRGDLVRQLLIESLLLAIAACAAGLLIAYGGKLLLVRFGARYVPLPRLNDIRIDLRVLLFTAGVSLLTTLACGLAPAMQAARLDVNDVLNQSGGRGTLGGAARGIRDALVVAQIALSCLLAVNASLLLRSFTALTATPVGFDRGGVLVMYAHAPARGGAAGGPGLDDYLRIGRYFDDLVNRLRALPDVAAAGAAMGLPTGQYNASGAYAVEGRQTLGGDTRLLPAAGFRLSSAGYFETLGIPLVGGRDFDQGDVYDRPFVAIVSQSLARQTFGDTDPIGHRIMCAFDAPTTWMSIVGVVGDVRQSSPAAPPGPEIYMPLRQHPYRANEVQVVVRSRTPPAALVGTVEQIVRSNNPDVAMKFTTLEDSVSNSTAAPRFRAALVSVFASLALLLALAGIYAVMSYTTAQRTAEFGLRVALGAGAIDVVGLVLAGAGRLSVIGVSAGLVLALATSRALGAMLFGVTSADPATYVGVVLAAIPLVVLAALVPAVRAARVDPLVALKSE